MPRDHPLRRRAGQDGDARAARAGGRRRGRPAPGICAMPAPREVHRRRHAGPVGRDAGDRRRDDRARATGRRRRCSPSGVVFGPLFVAAGLGRLWVGERGDRGDVPPHARPAASSSRSSTRRRRGAVLLARRRRHQRALGLTPVVFLVAGLFFLLAAMTYVEGASLHQDRAGATVFARYAFNELVELHRRLGDGARLRDPAVGHGVHGDELPGRVLGADRPAAKLENVVAAGDPRLGRVAEHPRLRARRRVQRIAALVVVDIVLQVRARRRSALACSSTPDLHHRLDRPRRRRRPGATRSSRSASRPSSSRASSRRPACRASCGSRRRGLKRLIASATISVARPVRRHRAWSRCRRCRSSANETSLARNYLETPRWSASPRRSTRAGTADPLKYVIAAAATATLIAAAGSAMLGLSRLSYALSTNRQIPSALGRLHPRRGTPYVVIILAAVIAARARPAARPRVPRRPLRVRRAARA